MEDQFQRTESLIGDIAVKKLLRSKVIVFGIGGVGGYVCEALARAGIGSLEIVDKDLIDRTNINRQILALHSTVGRPKTEVAEERLRDINPGHGNKGQAAVLPSGKRNRNLTSGSMTMWWTL